LTVAENNDRPTIAAAVVVLEASVLMAMRRVSEGALSWQFPAGEVEPGETVEEAAVRETREETGLDIEVVQHLGERVHPKTGRHMVYLACQVKSGEARVADTEELAEVQWTSHEQLPELVPYGLFEPVQKYLDDALT
jgi:8-oxo-dGTP diphosphatase